MLDWLRNLLDRRKNTGQLLETVEKGMNLDEFIHQALTDIAYGVHEAKVDSQDLMAIVPGSLNNEIQIEKSYISFDIAVTAGSKLDKSRSATGKAGGSINVYGAGINSGITGSSAISNSSHNETISRLKFKIPVFFNAHFRGDPGSLKERETVKKLVLERRQLSENNDQG